MEIPKRLRTSINDDDHLNFRKNKKNNDDTHGLLSSQEIFNFKNRIKVDKY